MICHLSWCKLLRLQAEQRGQMNAQLAVGEIGRKQFKEYKCMTDSLYFAIAKAERGDARC
jgi:hypothetical protein